METAIVYAARIIIAFVVIVVVLSSVLAVCFESIRGRKKAKPFKGIKLDYKHSRHAAVDLRDTSGTWRRTWRI